MRIRHIFPALKKWILPQSLTFTVKTKPPDADGSGFVRLDAACCCALSDTRSLALTHFGYFGDLKRSPERGKRAKGPENRDFNRFLRAEWRTGTRCRFLRRFGPNWPSWSWSCRRVSSWISPRSSAALPGSCFSCCCCWGCLGRWLLLVGPCWGESPWFVLSGGKVLSSSCHKFKSIFLQHRHAGCFGLSRGDLDAGDVVLWWCGTEEETYFCWTIVMFSWWITHKHTI